MPDSFATTPDGLLLVANGVQPMLVWDGLAPGASPAGVTPPASAPTLSGSGVGGIVGTYAAYLRYVDGRGNYSDLSPVSADFQPQGASGTITNVGSTSPLVVTSPGHGLTTGSVVKLTGVGGVSPANNTWAVTVLDPDSFSLDGSAASGTYSGGGSWVAGVAQVVYSGLEAPAQPRVVRRQLLRNTDGQASTFYVDLDTTDLSSPSLSSSLTDDLLSAQPSVPLLAPDGSPLANRFAVPPAHKAVVAHHLGRMFAGVEVVYSQGSVACTFGSPLVHGQGTEWTAAFAGRSLYVAGSSTRYEVASVDEAGQALTLTTPWQEPTTPYAPYAIRPAPSERRLVYYSEAGLPEAWPATNTLSVQEDGDEITGLVVEGSFLYVLEEAHVYRFTFQNDPAVDGYVFLSSASRGCINDRCWCAVDGAVLMLDRKGVHAFSGGEETEPVSGPIQDVFRLNDGPYEVNWRASDQFHVLHYPAQETLRWFVALSGSWLPEHALCFNYRLKRWWLERFPFPVGASCTVRYRGDQLPFLGADAGRVLAFWVNDLDGPAPGSGTLRGTATSSTLLTLTDARASFPAQGLVGNPLCLVDGRGAGQLRRVVGVSGQTLTLEQPWLVLPDATSVYQLGGIPYLYRTPWFQFAPDEEENPRRIEVLFEPAPAGLLRLTLTLDVAPAPYAWGYSQSLADGNGVRSLAGDPDLGVDLTKPSGFAQKRLDGFRETYTDGPRYCYWELSGVAGGETLIYQLTLDGVT